MIFKGIDCATPISKTVAENWLQRDIVLPAGICRVQLSA